MMAAESGGAPRWELTFDVHGAPDADGLARLTAQAAGGVTDLVVFAHAWNTDEALARALDARFFDLFAERTPGLGFVGVRWPSMRFADEPLPGTDAAGGGPALDEASARALHACFPDDPEPVAELIRLLAEQPPVQGEFDAFGVAVRKLADLPLESDHAVLAADTQDELVPQSDPAMLFDDTAAVCRGFLEALEETGACEPSRPGLGSGADDEDLSGLWHGARELLRQAVAYAVKRRAGVVGQQGLGPALAALAQASPGTRVHLVGHGIGARLAGFALRGLPDEVDTVASVTLLQGVLSHFAFSSNLPHDSRGKGMLHQQYMKVRGPVVCCYSAHDTSLEVFYPLASRMSGEWDGLLGVAHKWGALGFDGIHGVEGTVRCTLPEALQGKMPSHGCVNVDVAEVVRDGGPPMGAHHDVFHPELARLVLRAAGLPEA
ncbi:serine-threonine protein kinase [Streptomyces sp. NPDC060194]|uniref:serine-threonine protein kinase n=1 Tax=Streptomyces sp. NPDC060194 TaxID=3347069 RepID=UPI003654C379